MASTLAPRPARRDSKEAYRLWFEFLRRAIAVDDKAVRLDVYADAGWGDVTAYRSFPAWWRDRGEQAVGKSPVGITMVSQGQAGTDSYLLRVPKSMTSTQIGNEVRNYLISLGHQPVRDSTLRVAEGKEIRPQTYRAYLHTYDQYKKLELACGGGKVKGRDLLVAVRKFYISREAKFQNSVREVDKLPPALVTAMNRDDLNEVDVLASAVALNAINRYLREAKNIIAAVREGRFPE